MLKYIRLHTTSDVLFEQAWWLYEQAFPPDERRLRASQEHVLLKPMYHFEIVLHHGQFVAILLWWDFKDIRFIEHFATMPEERGKGMGRKIINEYILRSRKAILLEVDLPLDELSRRRIKFYQQLDFILNPFPYQQPALHAKSKPVKLKLMSYPKALEQGDLKHFLTQCHPMIYLS